MVGITTHFPLFAKWKRDQLNEAFSPQGEPQVQAAAEAQEPVREQPQAGQQADVFRDLCLILLAKVVTEGRGAALATQPQRSSVQANPAIKVAAGAGRERKRQELNVSR